MESLKRQLWMLECGAKNRVRQTLRRLKLLNTAKTIYAPFKSILDYRSSGKDGIFYRDEEIWMCSLFPSDLLKLILSRLNPASILDVGCGVGKSLDFFLAHGKDAYGVEGSRLAISRATNQSRIIEWDLRNELKLPRRFDLVFSYEVVEHIHPDHVQQLIRTFINHSDVIVLSAARPGQNGEGHFNEQPPEYWIRLFVQQNYLLDQELTSELQAGGDWFSANLLVLRKAGNGLAVPEAAA
jgi:SAM-dependent methyltransferase